MHEIWSFLETADGDQLQDTAYKMAVEAVRTARMFNGIPCGVLFYSSNTQQLKQLQQYGFSRLYCIQTDTHPSPELIAQSLHQAALKHHPLFLLFACTPLGTESAARTAVYLQRGLISRCVDFQRGEGGPIVRRTVYGRKADALVSWTAPPPYITTIEISALEDIRAPAKMVPEVVYMKAATSTLFTERVNHWKVDLAELGFSEARVVIGVGKGVSPKDLTSVRHLAKLLQGVIGGTRIAVFEGMVPHERQIGTTGKWLNSDVYLALGISGAPQHIMGLEDVKRIIAVNKDRNAPIFRRANLGIVGDVHDVIPWLVELLENYRERTI